MVDINKLMSFEDGQLNAKDTLELFSELIQTGQAWSLQGFYGRTAKNLIENGYIDRQGNILYDFHEEDL